MKKRIVAFAVCLAVLISAVCAGLSVFADEEIDESVVFFDDFSEDGIAENYVPAYGANLTVKDGRLVFNSPAAPEASSGAYPGFAVNLPEKLPESYTVSFDFNPVGMPQPMFLEVGCDTAAVPGNWWTGGNLYTMLQLHPDAYLFSDSENAGSYLDFSTNSGTDTPETEEQVAGQPWNGAHYKAWIADSFGDERYTAGSMEDAGALMSMRIVFDKTGDTPEVRVYYKRDIDPEWHLGIERAAFTGLKKTAGYIAFQSSVAGDFIIDNLKIETDIPVKQNLTPESGDFAFNSADYSVTEAEDGTKTVNVPVGTTVQQLIDAISTKDAEVDVYVSSAAAPDGPVDSSLVISAGNVGEGSLYVNLVKNGTVIGTYLITPVEKSQNQSSQPGNSGNGTDPSGGGANNGAGNSAGSGTVPPQTGDAFPLGATAAVAVAAACAVCAAVAFGKKSRG